MTSGNTVVIEDREISGPHGPIAIRVYRPEGVPLGGLVWLHGGAFVSGDLDMPESDWVARGFAGDGRVVVAVDYRLAPPPASWLAYMPDPGGTSRFPVASEEVAAAFRWASESFESVPHDRWALGGASAGANLAAGATLRLQDEGGTSPSAVLLAYPLVHAALPTMAEELEAKCSALTPPGGFASEIVDEMNLNYAGNVENLSDRYAFPGGHELIGFPPTIIVNSDSDSLRASGDLFASELIRAGVDVSVSREPGTLHGHLNEPETTGAQRTLARLIRWLRP